MITAGSSRPGRSSPWSTAPTH